ncbi:hypothetical protein IL306_006537 [Fusarium sp. DS 682]|nr:hypothetical protein IL306_006537 [Fusarium sp. DS 682]
MSRYHEAANGGSSPVEVSSASGSNPVQIILTPPTPIVSTGNFDRRGEDTFKEALPPVSEEKEVVRKTDGSDDKEVVMNEGHVEKEVYIPGEEKEVYDHGLEKEVHDLKLHHGHDEKQVYDTNIHNSQVHRIYSPEKEVLPQTHYESPEKEAYRPGYSAQSLPSQNTGGDSPIAIHKHNSNTDERRESVSTVSIDTSEKKGNAAQAYYQRHVNKWNQAVDKKKKAWTTFSNNSSTTMTEKVNQIDKGIKDRCTAFENGTTAKLNQLDKSISDSVDRAGKNVNTKVANWKVGMGNMKSQSMSSVKTLGSRYQIGGKEGKKDKESQ